MLSSTVSPIMEASPMTENQCSISEMCQQLSQGLSALTTTDDPFLGVPKSAPSTAQPPRTGNGNFPTMQSSNVPTVTADGQMILVSTVGSNVPSISHQGEIISRPTRRNSVF